MTLSLCLTALRRRRKIVLATLVVIGGGAAFFWSIGAALAFGLLAGAVLAVLLEKSDPTVKSVDDVRLRLGLTPLCLVPPISHPAPGEQADKRPLISAEAGQGEAAAALRRIAANLPKPDDRGAQVIMLTSSVPGEGKSTISGNLAALLGRDGYRVLLIGCDLRRPTLGKMFDQLDVPGLTDLLNLDHPSACRSLADPPIDFLPGGHIPDNPAELLDSQAMHTLMERLRKGYDYLVLDAPPVLPVTDAQLLVPFSDVLLAVLEPGRIRMDAARQMIEDLQTVGGEIDGLILNDRLGLAGRYYGGFPAAEPVRSGDESDAAPAGRRPLAVNHILAGLAVILAGIAGGLGWLVLATGPDPHSSKSVQVSMPAKVSRAVRPAVSAAPEAAKPGPATVTSFPAMPPSAVTGEPPALDRSERISTVTRSSADLPEAERKAAAEQVESAGQPAVEAKAPAGEPEPPVTAEVIAAGKPSATRPAPAPAPPEPDRQTAPAGSVKSAATVDATPVPVTRQPASSTQQQSPATGSTRVSEPLDPAVIAVSRVWGRSADPQGRPGQDLPEQLQSLGFASAPLTGALRPLLELETPLLLKLRASDGATAWHAVTGRRGYRWRLSPPLPQGELVSVPELEPLWTGTGHLPFIDPRRLADLAPGEANRQQVTILQNLLAATGSLGDFEPGRYDRSTIKALGRLQAENGLPVSGRLTPETLVLLYQADPENSAPKFSLWGPSGLERKP